METIIQNFHQYLIEQKCKDIAIFKTIIDGQDCNIIVASLPNVIENKKLADKIINDFKLEGFPEGYSKGEWIVFDFNDIILNCFIPNVREKFNLEKLWQKEKVEGIIKEVISKKKVNTKKKEKK